MKTKIAASIVLYKDDLAVIRSAIESYLKTDLDLTLYLVDNSPDKSLEILGQYEKTEYIFNPSNPGFGAAHNIAILKSIEMGSKYHLVLNPDVFFMEGTIENLVAYMNLNDSVGNVMPKVLYPDKSIQYLCKLLPTPYDWIGRRFNPMKSLVDKRNEIFELRFTNYDKIMEVPYLSGCFMLLRVDALEKIGLFDEKIFMYGEETDLCRRLISAGYKTIFNPDAVIYHHFRKGSHKSWRLTKIGMQSAIYYFNKWGWFFDKRRKQINRDILKKLGK